MCTLNDQLNAVKDLKPEGKEAKTEAKEIKSEVKKEVEP